MKSTNGWILKTIFPPLISKASASLVASFWGGRQRYLRTYCHIWLTMALYLLHISNPRLLHWQKIEPMSPALAGGCFPNEPPGKPSRSFWVCQCSPLAQACCHLRPCLVEGSVAAEHSWHVGPDGDWWTSLMNSFSSVCFSLLLLLSLWVIPSLRDSVAINTVSFLDLFQNLTVDDL